MRFSATTLAALALAAAAAGCGDEDQGEPIPAQRAEAMLAQLDNIESQVDAGNCGSAEFQVRGDGELQDKIGALPDDVDADVRTALEDGANRLLELIEDQCGADEEEQPTNTVEPEPPPETQETQPPETTETQPPPETTETQPPPETTETQPPPDQGEPPLPAPDEDGGGAGGQTTPRGARETR